MVGTRWIGAMGLAAAMTTVAGGTIPADAGAAAVTCRGRTATIVGTDSGDDITGTRGNDVIHSLGGFDAVDGRGGNDVICGGPGADSLRGGAGSYRIFGERGGMTSHGRDDHWAGNAVRGGPGNDYLSGGPDHVESGTPDRADYSESTGPIVVGRDGRVTGPGVGTDTLAPDFELIVGTTRADRLLTVGPRSSLRSLAGADQLRVRPGVTGVDLYSGPGVDRIDGTQASGPLQLAGGEGDDVLLAGPAADRVFSEDGSDVVRTYGGDDYVLSDAWDAVRGSDTVQSGAGDDLILLGIGPMSRGTDITTGPGTDTLETTWTGGRAIVDAATGVTRLGDNLVARFADVERHQFRGPYQRGDLYFTGSALADDVDVTFQALSTITVLAKGGDDTVSLEGTESLDVYIRGGDGDDRIHGSDTDDTLIGDSGDDTVDGAAGVTDRCDAEQEANCELEP